MDESRIATLARTLASRRTLATLGGAALLPFLAAPGAEAKKKKHKARKKSFCLNGETVQASGKKVKKLTKRGATPGACTACVPQCNGVSCGGADGCGGVCGCASGSVCNDGSCVACTVTCDGTPLACGTRLKVALGDGGTVIACPGRYAEFYQVTKVTTLIGAGPGADPATSTILDGQGTGKVTIDVSAPGVFQMSGVRVTGSSLAGLRVLGPVDGRIRNCAIADNPATGGGIIASGKLNLTDSTVSGNTSQSTGGGVYLEAIGPHVFDGCVVAGNTAVTEGGGLYTSNAANVTMTGTQLHDNKANQGAGIYMDSGNVRLDSATTITNNTATTAGGGVFRFAGTFTRNDATITGNTAPAFPNCNAGLCP